MRPSARCPNTISLGTGAKTISWSHSFKRSRSDRSLDKNRTVLKLSSRGHGELCLDAAENSVKPPHVLSLRGNALNKPRDKMRGLTDSDAEATEIHPPPPGLRSDIPHTAMVPSVEVQLGFSPTVTWGYDGEESTVRPVYFSHKARVSCRHQMDGNIIDATC
ncbi:uncharacterized protein si:ch211-237l4.6 [Myxocyprinus asiaticus]|uniref:uncharacterized protein si:ch211-237l4.6 n=1 Tax=Myxocyprinus asiaticus TaxID=70543 RepID=UPI0022225D16|nr:uncharacterized protein si:ch211-237l4.6 [Myxocyprinus asiaticus]